MRKPSWKIRRRIIHITLLFCALCVAYILVLGDAARSSLLEIITMCCFGMATAVIGSYIFGAAWDDKNFMSATKPKEPPTASQTYDEGAFPPDPYGG